MVKIAKKISISLISSVLAFSPLGVVYAKGGGQQMQLQEIDSLIENRDYNEALKQLSDFIRNNPTQFDEAQKRINQIMNARYDLTGLAEELVSVIQNDPENDELKLELIDRIENIEINPSPQMSAFLASTRRAAEFAVNRIKFQNIIAEGTTCTADGRYTEAVTSQLKGFLVYYDTFVRENDAETVAAVDRQIEDVKVQAGRFDEIRQEAENAIAALKISMQRDETAGTRRALARVQQAMTDYAALRNAIADTGYDFQKQFALMAAEQGLETEASYLPFAWRFILGTSSEAHSGIIGAMDYLWNDMIESTKPDAVAAALVHCDRFIPLVADGSTRSVTAAAAAAGQELTSARLYLEAGLALENLNSLCAVPEDLSYRQLITDMNAVSAGIRDLISRDESFRQISALADASGFDSVAESAGSAVSEGDFSWFRQTQDLYARVNGLYEASIAYSGSIMDVTGRLQSLDGQITSSQFLDNALSLGLALQSESMEYRQRLLSWMQQYADRAASDIAATRTESYRQCHALLNEELDPEVASYPQTVITRAAGLSPEFQRTSANLQAFSQLAGTVCSTTQVQAAAGTLALLTEQTITLKSLAEDRVLQADRIFAEGELRYSEAQKAIKRDDYSSARSSLQRAGSKYAESFLYRQDAALRSQCDAKLLALGDEINRLENERIVLEVRRLKKQAKTEYYAGNFEMADSLLQQAKARWLITNVDDDPEIIQLLALVGTALSMKTGRTLSPSAPLYPEMSQTLNIAHSYFSEGESLLKKGDRKGGVAALEQARQKIRELQLVYPLNQDASLMSLQIDKLIDPAAFETYFAQKVTAAREDYKDKQKQRQVYADLLDLYEINPSYPGLKDFIYTVEIELGIRQKPIDRTAQNQSAALYKEAVALYNKNSRDEINLRSALAKVDEALTKNPDNEEAQTLKDRINIALGGSGSVVLPSDAENMYQKAVQELQKGNTIQAAAIVMQLMQNPDYAKSAKILDLKKKVDSLL